MVEDSEELLDAISVLVDSEERLFSTSTCVVELVAAGGCAALVEALKIAEDENTRNVISTIIYQVSRIEEGRASLVAEGCCPVLVNTLKISEADKLNTFCAIFKVAENKEGCAAFV